MSGTASAELVRVVQDCVIENWICRWFYSKTAKIMNAFRQVQATVFLLILAASARTVMLLQNREMATHPAFLGFVGDWTIMMAAMMLPSFAPIASRYSKMVDSRRWLGMIGVVIGYVGV